MNTESPNEMQEIEALLRKLPLRQPSMELDRRVLTQVQRRSGFPWRIAAAAAVVCIVSTTVVLSRNVWKPSTTGSVGVNSAMTAVPRSLEVAVEPEKLTRNMPSNDTAPYSGGPLRVQRTLAAMSNDGLMERAGETPVHVYRCETVKEIFFVDPEHNSRMSVTVPIERVVMIPVQSF